MRKMAMENQRGGCGRTTAQLNLAAVPANEVIDSRKLPEQLEAPNKQTDDRVTSVRGIIDGTI